MVTIYDVAKEAGCSPTTVSKAFNNYSGVNTDTYKRIMEAADKLGYTPNTNARALATKKTWLLGVLFSEDVNTGIAHPHFSEILQSFQVRAGEYGYDVVFVNKRLGNREASYLEHCMYRGVDGVLLAANKMFTDEIQSVLSSDIKCVSVETNYPNKYTVISDNRMGSLQAMEYLYLLGHRKIAHMACPLTSVAGQERYSAYKEFLESKGLEENPKYVVEIAEFKPEEGMKAATQLLQQAWDDLPTAIYCGYDDIACAAMNTFRAQGFRVPEDLSIIGFDNVAISGFTTPSLTTIEQDRATIGIKAADTLIKMIEGKQIEEPFDNRIPTKLIVRNSCARII
ncbi:MAG TPA: LacI family DNA-binding transcriptional regulator [Patescibacteria group bacterium]|nr:LacI family DNA-binding transcriptional regulator [Patescibacteria group bacterium]